MKQAADRDLERDMGGVKLILKKKYTREERIARALDVIDENGFIGLTDYAYINNLSRTAASLELKEISHDETVPIRSVGQHSHKVWVRRKNKIKYDFSSFSLVVRKYYCSFAQRKNKV